MAGPLIKHTEKLGSLTYASNGRPTLDINRAGVLLGLDLHLTYTVTNGSSAAVGPFYQTLARLLKRVELIVAGKDTVWSVSGPTLAVMAHLTNAYPAYGMDSTVVLTGSSTATTYEIVIPLRFTLDDGKRPDDTALDLRIVSQAILAVTWGPSDASDFYGTPNSAAISNVSLNVEAEYLQGVDDNAVFLVRALDEMQRTVDGNSTAFDLIVDRASGVFIRSLMLTSTDAKVGEDDIINDVTLKAGSYVFLHKKPVNIKAMMKRERKLETLPAGVLFIDGTLFGQAVTMINTRLLTSDLRFTLDVTKGSGTTEITVTREIVRPLALT